MKTIYFFIALLLFSLTSCEKNSENDLKNNSFNARVLGKGFDCGGLYLIKFNNDVIGLPPNAFDNVFYAINLPPDLQVENLEVNVNFRAPYDNEIIPCLSMGVAYPQIIIEP